MNIINTLNDKRFTFNGIQYFKNYVSVVHGNKIEIFNCYERKDVLVELALYDQFTVNGTVYSSAAQLQEALLPVLYSRINMGDGSTFAQNNIGRTINIGFYSGDTSIANIVSMMNNRTTTISSTDTPVVLSLISLPASMGNPQLTNKKHSYLFKPGEGVYGIGGTTVTSSMIFQLASLNLTPEDIQNTPGTLIYNLDPVTNEDYITKANETTWDFTNSGKVNEDGSIVTYYFSYTTEDILYFVQFKGTPGIYGFGNTPFEEEDFAATTNSNVTPEKTKLSEFINDVPFANLDANGKVPLSQINDALIGAVNYQGTYNASNNTPPLPVATGNKGKYYIVSTAGTQQGFDLNIGDWIISNGSVWGKVDNTDSVVSVAGKVGIVILGLSDIVGLNAALDLKAPLASPAFTGTPTAPNSLGTDRSTKIATTHFVKSVLENAIKANTLQISGGGSVFNLTGSDFTNSDGVICDRLEVYVSNLSNYTINLPDVSTVGFRREIFILKRLNNAFTITITPPAGSTINGQASYVLVNQFDKAVIISDGTNYFLTSFKDKDLISQTITDGITDSAPSQNAIYDNFRRWVASSETNLNNFQETGSFLTAAATLTNLPTGWPQGRHMMLVSGSTASNYCTQIITNLTTGLVAFRKLLTTDWSEWVEYSEKNKTLTQGSNIPANANLDTYQTTGIYTQITNANAASGTNYPTPLAGKLEVVNTLDGSGFTYQTYHTYAQNNDIYVRTRNGAVWYSWVKLSDAVDLDSKSDKNITLTIGGTIPPSADLNTYTTTGLYPQTSNTNASSGINYPVLDKGMLEVTKGATTQICQKYHVLTLNKVYVRVFDTSWGDWRTISNDLDLSLKADKATAFPTTYLAPVNALSISTGSINDVPKGSYVSVLASAVTDVPFAQPAALLSLGNTTLGGQFLIGRSSDNVYFRSVLSGFQVWRKLINDLDLATKQDAFTGSQSNVIRGDGTPRSKDLFVFLDSVLPVSGFTPINTPIVSGDTASAIASKAQGQLNDKQNTLISGSNIKTINGGSILGGGNIIVGDVINGGNTGTLKIGTLTNGGNINFVRNGLNYLTFEDLGLSINKSSDYFIRNTSGKAKLTFNLNGSIEFSTEPPDTVRAYTMARIDGTGDILNLRSGVNGITLVGGVRNDGRFFGTNAIASDDFVSKGQMDSALDTKPTIGYTAPTSSTAMGIKGEMRITSTYVYYCIDTNTWVRSAAATW
ncbi:hypothetical protein D3C87_395580 [compost metagenome]